MADALVEFARTHSVEPRPDRVEHFQNFPGEGISGKIEDNEVYVGNKKIASRAGCSEVPNLEGYDIEGKSVGYVFMASTPVAIFFLSDMCRTGTKEAVEELKSLGIKTVMLTGDCQGAAQLAQDQLGGGLDVIRAELLPEDKAGIIKELQKEGPTAMIGDGLNDAPALATADVGISMGISGSALATESGDVVLMTNDIQRVPKAVRIARRVKRKIIENVILSISTKAAIIGLAVAGHPLVWAAVLSDVGTCLLVIFNSMLLLRGTSSGGEAHEHVHKKKAMDSCCDEKYHKLHSCSSKEHDHSKHDDPCHNARSHHSCNGHRVKNRESRTNEDDIVDNHHDLEAQSHGDSCGTKKCSGSTTEHAHTHHDHHHHPKPHGHGSIEKHAHTAHTHHDHDHGPKPHSHGTSCGTGKCTSSIDKHAHNASCGEHNHEHEHEHGCSSASAKHKHGGTKKCSGSTTEHAHTRHDHDHHPKPHSHGSIERHGHSAHTHHDHDHGPQPHSHGTSCGTGKCTTSTDKHDHNHEHEHKHGCSSASAKHCNGDEGEEGRDKAGHCKGGETGCEGGTKKVHRGCCESYRRECCVRRSGHFEANLRGGLSEIVIE